MIDFQEGDWLNNTGKFFILIKLGKKKKKK